MTVAAQDGELTFQKELFYSCLHELPPLFLAEWQEIIGDNPTEQELDPAWDKYVQMEMNGLLYMLTARHHGKLVGYFINIIHPHLHFSKKLYAFVDAFYLAPEFRRNDLDVEFVLENELALTREGAKRINAAVPASSWLYRLLKRLQYTRTECILAKWL